MQKLESKISVIIPLFNKESTILKSINSVLTQSYKNIELIVIDDGSTDSSYRIVRNACKERFKIYRKENSGVSDSRNFGALKATGNLIFFLDADDIIKVNCLEILNDLVDKNPSCSVFCGNFEIIKKDSVLIPKFCKLDRTCNISNTFKQIYFGNIFLRAGNTLIDKEVFLEIGGFKKNLSFYEDVGFFLDLVRSNNVVYTPEVIFSYEQEYTYLSKNVAALSKDWS